MMKLLARTLTLLLLCGTVNATEYFIDFASGSDSNNGTSTATPWKHHPFMNGWTGSYTHVAGDDYIFKGGVTWTNAAFCMEVLVGGVSGNRDVYGPDDKSWFTGASWSRPIFDMQNASITGCSGSPVSFGSGADFVTFDNFEIKNHRISGTTGGSKEGGIKLNGAREITISNNFVHDWDHSGRTDGGHFGGIISIGFDSPIVVTRNTVRGPPAVAGPTGQEGSGACFSQHFTELSYNECSLVDTGCFACVREIHHNYFHDQLDSFDAAFHENGAWISPGPTQFHHNVMDAFGVGTALFVIPCFGTPVGVFKIYNNVFYASETVPIHLDTSAASASCSVNSIIDVYNNTVFSGSGAALSLTNRPRPLGTGTIQNNHWITDAADPTCIGGGCQTITNLTENNNAFMTNAQAAAEGYIIAADSINTVTGVTNFISGRHVNVTNTPIDQGLDLSSIFTTDIQDNPRSAVWDTRAYELDGACLGPSCDPPPSAPTGLRVTSSPPSAE